VQFTALGSASPRLTVEEGERIGVCLGDVCQRLLRVLLVCVGLVRALDEGWWWCWRPWGEATYASQLLTKWYQPTRLETRTKESNMGASK
jgi:hypothetical protein